MYTRQIPKGTYGGNPQSGNWLRLSQRPIEVLWSHDTIEKCMK